MKTSQLRSAMERFSKVWGHGLSYRLGGAFAVSISYLILFISSWFPLKQQGMGGGHNYADLNSVIQAAKCFQTIGSQVYSPSGNCQYQYGRPLLSFLEITHLTSLRPIFFGFIFVITVVSVLAIIAFQTTISTRSLVFNMIILVNTGTWLLLERGNFDSLILLFVSLAIFLLRSRGFYIAVILVAFTALFKFYTFPLLLLISSTQTSRVKKIFALITAVVILPMIFSDIRSVPSFPYPTFAAFGSPSPGLWLNFFSWRFKIDIKLSEILSFTLGSLLLVIGVYLVSALDKRKYIVLPLQGFKEKSGYLETCFKFSSFIYISCYLAGMNFDYRLIFLSIALVLLNFSNPNLLLSKFILSLEFSALWFTYYFFGKTGAIPVLLALWGNISQYILTCLLIVILSKHLVKDVTFLYLRGNFEKNA